MANLDPLNKGADNFTLGGPVCIAQRVLQVAQNFRKAALNRSQVCLPALIRRLSSDLRIDLYYPRFGSVHLSRELLFLNHPFCETVDQAIHTSLWFVPLRYQRMDVRLNFNSVGSVSVL